MLKQLNQQPRLLNSLKLRSEVLLLVVLAIVVLRGIGLELLALGSLRKRLES